MTECKYKKVVEIIRRTSVINPDPLINFYLVHEVDANDNPKDYTFFQLSKLEAAALMASLWEAGIRPDQFKDMFSNLINKLGQL